MPKSRTFSALSCFVPIALTFFAARLEAQTSTITQSAPLRLRTTLEASSAAIQRGKTFVDGPAFLPSAWLVTPFGVNFGAWGAIPLENRDGRDPVFYKQSEGQLAKLDLYLYYKGPSFSALDLEFMLAQYQFPQGNRLPERVMNDAMTKISVPVFLHPYLFASYGLSGIIKADTYLEAGVQETLYQYQAHSVGMQALSTYRIPDEKTRTKAEGQGHSQLSLAYGYGGLRLAANYIWEGEKAVLDVNEDTRLSASLGYTSLL